MNRDIVAFTPGYQIQPGEDVAYVPADLFPKFLDGLADAISNSTRR